MEQRLILADGSRLEGCSCGYDGEYSLWCFLKNLTFGDAFQLFSDPARFVTVIFEMEDAAAVTRITYTGLTELSAIQQGGNEINVRLKGMDIQSREEHLHKEGEDANGVLYNTDSDQS